MKLIKSFGKAALRVVKSKAEDFVATCNLISEALTFEDGQLFSYKPGDFVWNKEDGGFYMVIKAKTHDKEGVLARLDAQMLEWFLRFTYCPYSKSVSDDSDCSISTQACDKEDGQRNREFIRHLIHEIETKVHDPLGCPPPIEKFPAFKFADKMSGDVYIPAIVELFDLFGNEDLKIHFFELINKCHPGMIPLGEEILIWSSTDNVSAYGKEAQAIKVVPHCPTVVRSLSKSDRAFVIPFKRF